MKSWYNHSMIFQPPTPPFCLILGNGDYPGESLVKEISDIADFIICSDGGANVAKKFGIVPNVIIGDMDSITPDTNRFFASMNVDIIPLESQQENDLEKAIFYLQNHHPCKSVVLLGFLGLREDHSYATLQILENHCQTTKFQIYSQSAEYLVLPSGNHEFSLPKKQLVSVFPFPEAEQLSSSGLFWNFNFDTFPKGSRGVSNQVTDTPVKISFKRGNLLVILPV